MGTNGLGSELGFSDPGSWLGQRALSIPRLIAVSLNAGLRQEVSIRPMSGYHVGVGVPVRRTDHGRCLTRSYSSLARVPALK